MDEKIPVTIISGFLGSGKTTFLNRILQLEKYAFSAVLVNELGSIAIDDSLIASQSENTITLTNGCICCAIQEDLIQSLGELLNRLEKGEVATISRVFIETTGIADPTAIIRSLLLYPYLAQNFALHGLLTLADPLNFRANVSEFPECRAQLAVADVVLITKTDLISEQELSDFIEQLGPYCEGARVAAAEKLDTLFPSLENGHIVFNRLPELQIADGEIHSDFSTYSFRGDAHLGIEELQAFVAAVAVRLGTELLRLKGIVAVANQPGPVVIQMVRSVMAEPEFLEKWPRGESGSRLVFIGTALDPEAVRDCAAILGCS